MTLQKYLLKFNSTKSGLQDHQIEDNRRIFGDNVLLRTKRESFFLILLKQFGSFFSILLFVSAGILFVLGQFVDFYIVLFVIMINTSIETLQRHKSDSIFEALTKNMPFYSTVFRNGKRVKIESSKIVVGDVVILSAGDKISADIILFEAVDFRVDESILTGESKAVVKEVNDTNSYNPDAISENMQVAFSGTHVVTGEAKGLVVYVGSDTQLGKITQTLSTIDNELPIHKNIKKLSYFIFCIALTLSLFILVVGLVQGQSAVEIFKVTVALFVSAIPESLPVMLTLVLAYGFKRMSEKNVLVRKMQSLDVLGQIDTLALDKTGTITQNQMKVEKVFTISDGEHYVTGEGYEPVGNLIKDEKKQPISDRKNLVNLVHAGLFSSNGTFDFDQEHDEWKLITGDPTEVALLVLAQKFGFTKDDDLQHTLVKDTPFSNSRMYHETEYDVSGESLAYLTGAPEVLLKKTTHIHEGEDISKISDETYNQISKQIDSYTSQGYRTIASCMKKDKSIIFLGLFAIQDSIRKDIFESVAQVTAQDIKIIIITGDHPEIALQVARKIGVVSDVSSLITGEEMQNLTSTQLKNIISHKNIFARVTPQQKLKILELLKSSGRVVAMTGDGVNDSLALVKADIGIAMGKLSSDVAKEASDIVLLDNKFGSIVYGIEEGKNIFSNINKVILFLLSTNFAEMLVVVICVVLMLPLPLSAAAILWLNLVTDTFLVIGFAFERSVQKKRKNVLISKKDWLRVLYLSFVMTMLSLVAFTYAIQHGLIYAQSVTLLSLIIMQWFNVLNIKAGNKDSIFKITKEHNPVFLIGYAVSILLTLFAFNSQFMNEILEIQPINFIDWLYITLLASGIIWFEELRKLFRK